MGVATVKVKPSQGTISLLSWRVMSDDVHQTFSSHLCSKCGGPAPEWKCPECGLVSAKFDPMHFQICETNGKMQAQCEKCGEAESKCSCDAEQQ